MIERISNPMTGENWFSWKRKAKGDVSFRRIGGHMPEIAKCPCCDSELIPHSDADVEYSAEGTTCIGHSVSWKCEDCSFACDEKYLSRISAAMELAEAKAWRQEVWEATRKPWDFVDVLYERKSIESVLDILDQSEEDVKSAEKRVLEVFK